MNIIGGVLRLGRGRGENSNEQGREPSRERNPEGGEEGKETKASNRVPTAKELGLKREQHVPHSKSQSRLGFYLADRCFRKWRCAAQEAALDSEHQQVNHYFQRWKLHACTSLVAWMCADHFHACLLHELKVTCFKEWRTQVEFRRYMTGILSEEHELLRKYFRIWLGGEYEGFDSISSFVEAVGSLEETQEEEETLQDVQAGKMITKWVENIAKRKLSARVFYQWCKHTCLEPAWQIQRALAWRQRKIARVAFTAWWHAFDHQKASRDIGVQLLESLLVKHTFGWWLDVAMVVDGQGAPADGVGAVVGVSLTGASILETRRRENAARDSWARVLRCKKVLRTAFVVWRAETHPPTAELSVERVTTLRWRQCCSMVIRSWNEYAQAKHVQAVVVGRFQTRQDRLLMRKSLQGWWSVKNRVVAAQVAEYRADCHYSRRFLDKFIRRWYMECLSQQDRHLAAAICFNLYTRSRLRRAFNAWVGFATQKNHHRMVILEIEMKQLRRVYHAWWDAIQAASRQRWGLKSAAKHRSVSILGAAWRVWKEMVDEVVETRCCHAELFHKRKQLKKCFLGLHAAKKWASASRDRRRDSAIQSLCFARWCEVVLNTKTACSILQGVKKRGATIMQAQVFVCWKSITEQGMLWEAENFDLAVQHHENQVMKRAWVVLFGVYVARLKMEADRVQMNKQRLKVLKAYFIPWHREAYERYRAQAKDLLNLVKENIQHLNIQKPSHMPGPSIQAPARASAAMTLGNVQNYPQINAPPNYNESYGGDHLAHIRQSLYLGQLEPENHPRPS